MRNIPKCSTVRILQFVAAILLLSCCTWAQDAVARFERPAGAIHKSFPTDAPQGPAASEPKDEPQVAMAVPEAERSFASLSGTPVIPRRFPRAYPADTWDLPAAIFSKADADNLDAQAVPTPPRDDDKSIVLKEKFHWKPALAQSMLFLSVQHGFRMTQPKTARELGGPFFKDWFQSVKNMRGWRDGDSSFTNYVGHPLQGATTGRIFVNNSDRARKQEFGLSREYWNSRVKALLWSAFWSTQFELGPISEASLGNVGMTYQNGYCTMAHVDLVVTPVVGTAVLIGEDAIDKYVLKNWLERGNSSKLKIRILRSFLTPSMSATNLIRLKVPWKRDERPL